MNMKRVTQRFFLAGAVLTISSTANAQIEGSPTSGGRRTEFEYLDKGFDVNGINSSDQTLDYWDTPAGKKRYLQGQLKRLGEDVEELSDLGK